MNLDPQTTAALLTGLLTLLGGLFGYLYRQYRTAAKPFFRVIRVEGEVQDDVRVPVPAKVTDLMSSSTFYSRLSTNATPDELRQVRQEFEVIEQHAHQLIKTIDAFRESVARGSEDDAQLHLRDILKNNYYDFWLTPMIGENHVTIPVADETKAIRISVLEDAQHRNGCYWVGFPNQPLLFGQQLNDFSVFKIHMRSFMQLIERLELEKLAELLARVKLNIESALAVGREVLPEIRKLIDRNSRWTIRVFGANLGQYPLLLDPIARLIVQDKETSAKFEEVCDLIILHEQHGRIRSPEPVVLGPEKSITFEFATKLTQGQMERGSAFRDAFAANKAICSVKMTLQSVGYRGRSEASTPEVAFAATLIHV